FWLRPNPPERAEAEPSTIRVRRGVELLGLLALAVLLGLLARTLGRVLIATPAALWSLPIAALVLVIGTRRRSLALAPMLVAAALAAALLGASFEAAGPQPNGREYGSPVLGVHPRQAVAVRIDGFGPHDIIADDYVDPPGGQGYDPQRWAARLEAELHAIAALHYAEGPARARAAYANAEVEVHEALVPAHERELHASLLGLEIRSGTIGEGSTVELVCPGQPLDPRGGSASAAVDRSCPRKYLPDGSTGLGLAARFPGHTQVVGRDRARLAGLLGWPSGDAKADRRALALESGAWLLMLVIVAWLLARARDRSEAARGGAVMIGIAMVATLALALLVPPSASSTHGGPTLLAIVLLLMPTHGKREPAALPCALLLALLAASPLAGHGDALELLAITRDGLFDLGLAWPIASAIAGSLAAVVLTIGAGISAVALIDRSHARERRHTGALVLALALACGLGLALRKPVDDLPLLQGAGALLTLALVRMRSRPQQLALALACTAAAVAPILDGDARNPIVLALVGLAAVLCLGLGSALGFRSVPEPVGPSAR
ncbi:MAG TPA: hypothetical protein VM869_15745, partial [Enhygromyxa sp.]|nr:hypothetical protein [Enhygromyxa sp.]